MDFPDELCFCVTKDTAYFEAKTALDQRQELRFSRQELSFGENLFDSHAIGITLTREKDDSYYKKLKSTYQKVFFADLSNAYSGGTLYLREREEGDAYRYGGMTRKVKKLFSDRKLSEYERKRRLLLCDDEGILWIPGFPLREAKEKKTNAIYAYFFMNGGKDE